MPKEKIIKGGLNPTPKDKRDFSLGKVFGVLKPEMIPDKEFYIGEPIEIKDQWDSDCCSAFAGASVSEDQEGVALDPLFLFAKIKEIEGNYEGWGADLRSACKALVKKGTIEVEQSPYKLEEDGRNFIANWENWNDKYDDMAQIHRKKSYFAIDGQSNLFDSIRSAMWQHRSDKSSVLTGVVWQEEWTLTENGIIPKKMGNKSFGHAIKIFGQKIINNEPYLVAQLSNGTDIGEGGLFYFPKEVVNRDFTFGAYMFKDYDPEEAKQLCWNWWQKFWYMIISYFNLAWA